MNGLTHNFYRYPARFTPEFARAAIEVFTKESDTVLDPFVGGGTSVVEALAMGRRAIGADLNSLAVFVTRSKTTPLSKRERAFIKEWISQNDNTRARHPDIAQRFNGFSKDVPVHLRHLIAVALENSESMPPTAQKFSRCALLRTGQWALDCREQIPTRREFLNSLSENTHDMLQKIEKFGHQASLAGKVTTTKLSSRRRLFCKVAKSLSPGIIPPDWPKPSLVLTSPPYPGVNVLYNRWQVQGRRETSFAYGISGTGDGYYNSHYTFTPRNGSIDLYISRIVDSFSAVRRMVNSNAVVVQLVAFSEPRKQLPRYLEAMEAAGFMEDRVIGERRIWREVPNRKWYNRTNEKRRAPASREALLIHRPA